MGIRMTIQDTDAVTTNDLLSQLPNSKFAKEVKTLREMEIQLCDRLGELAKLCNTVIPYVLEMASVAAAKVPKDVEDAANDIADYIDAVRPETQPVGDSSDRARV